MPITPRPHYADHPLAPICRSRLGSYMPVGDTAEIIDRIPSNALALRAARSPLPGANTLKVIEGTAARTSMRPR
jgi:hypothetical protein